VSVYLNGVEVGTMQYDVLTIVLPIISVTLAMFLIVASIKMFRRAV